MSVRVGDRSEGQLQVLKVASDIANYTLTICSNEKSFPKSKRWMITQRIVGEALDGYACIRTANISRRDDVFEKSFRRQKQVEARGHYNSLLGYIDIAYSHFNLDSKRVDYWGGMIDHEISLLNKWINSEKE